LACSPEDAQVNSPGAGNRWKFEKVSGDNQSTLATDTLAERLTVQLTTLTGTGIENEQIHFYLIHGDGQVQKPVASGKISELVTFTDFFGQASAQFENWGGDSLGVSRVKAEVLDSSQFSVEFTIGTI
jgi:hypothetical protein